MSTNQYEGRPFEWDRPGRGLYDDGSIRIITRRDSDGVFVCHKASDEEVRFVMLLEAITAATRPVRSNHEQSNR